MTWPSVFGVLFCLLSSGLVLCRSKQAGRQASRQASRQAGRQTGRQAGRQASKHACMHAGTHAALAGCLSCSDDLTVWEHLEL